jgi:hypothetical protein
VSEAAYIARLLGALVDGADEAGAVFVWPDGRTQRLEAASPLWPALLSLSWEGRREAETRRCIELARLGMSHKEITRAVGINAGRVGKLLELSGFNAERAADRARRVRDALLGIARGETYAAAARRVGVSLSSVRHAADEALAHRGGWREPCPDCGAPAPVPWGGRCEPRVRAFLEGEGWPR